MKSLKLTNNWLNIPKQVSEDDIVFVDDEGYDIQCKEKILTLDIETTAVNPGNGEITYQYSADNIWSQVLGVCPVFYSFLVLSIEK